MTSKPYTIRWGIMATGNIAKTFTKDLLTNPQTRSVTDIAHVVSAVASSTSSSRALAFLSETSAPSTAKAYGNYHDLVSDPEIDVIYVATPHSHHFQNAMLALSAGKHVLCEKALTVNAAQARKLVETAREKKVFFMEALWTRFFPLSIKIREMVQEGAIGRVHRVLSDLSFGNGNEDLSLNFEPAHRMVNKALAGGALLDLGIYSLTWVFQILYHCQAASERESPRVVSAMNLYEHTGADEMTSMILQFEKHKSMGVALTSLRVATQPDETHAAGPAIRIQGTKGEIQVFGPAFRPLRYRVIMKDGKVEDVDCEIPRDEEREGLEGQKGWGHGMFWEADEVARCLRDGKLESQSMGWEESVLIMETMDEVRRQGGLVYSDLIESSVFDEKSSLNMSV
ncbi:hypothetical protein B7494_g6533 [Chlorociboria aeruginascens]|nr:hypothetical protein B7494_g6533 [Chlorociboria aeruginascens]